MKDAFGKKIKEGTKVLYSTRNSAGTIYVIGTVSQLLPGKPFDRIAVTPIKATKRNFGGYNKDPIIYASNAVVIKDL